jgi:hypothetical protein
MKKQTNPTIKAQLIRGAFYLLLLIAVCAIPFALAQRNVAKQGVAKPVVKPNVIPVQKSLTSAPAGVCSNYTTSTSTDTIVPGDTDTGNHCDDCTTAITFPFPVSLYGTSGYTSALVSSNGNLQLTGNTSYLGTSCPLPDPSLDEAILAYQDDLRTDAQPDCSAFASGCGIFTAVTGTAPNRVFVIEWRTAYFGRSGTANFEVLFYENNPFCFDVIYGSTVDDGSSEESGVQQSATGPGATTFSCNEPTLTNGLKVTYCCEGATPTPTPCDSGIIQNGGFETGSFPPWVILDQNATPVVTTTQAHSGTYSGFVGDAPDGFCGFPGAEALGDSSFYQEFTVPAGTSTLSFWHWDCTTDSIVFDWQDAYITDTSGTILQTIFHQCNDTETWLNTQVDMSPYAGQTVRVEFLVHEDAAGDLTGMYVDDVQLLVPCETPTPSPSPTPTATATATVTATATATPTPTPTGTPSGCVFGQGYWKNHPDQWPVTELQLGNVTYTQEELLSILHQSVRGNGLVLLAHQLIAAKLNIANGTDPSCIEQTIADADALIGDLVVPPVGTGYLAPSNVSALAETLDQYNEGLLCAPSCEGSPSPTATPRGRLRPTPPPRPR